MSLKILEKLEPSGRVWSKSVKISWARIWAPWVAFVLMLRGDSPSLARSALTRRTTSSAMAWGSMETGLVTVRTAESFTPFLAVTVMTAVPALWAVMRPLWVTVATEGSLEDQVCVLSAALLG